jgi:hypothetical protein
MEVSFIKYLKTNFSIGMRRSWVWMGGIGRIMDVMIAAIVGKVLGQNDVVKIGIITVVVALTIYVFVSIVFAVFVVPFQESIKQEREKESQKKTISRFIKQFERDKTKTTKIEITPREDVPHLDDADQYYYAYLEIYNGEDSDLLDCYANLTELSINIHDTQEWGNYLDWVTGGGTNELIFPKFDAKDQKRVRRKNKERIDIAKWKPEAYPIFLFVDGKEETIPEKRIYIEVSLNGEMNKNGRLKAIEELRFCGFLTRHQGSYTQEGATITTTVNGKTIKEKQPDEELPYSRFYKKPGELKIEKEHQN